MPFSTVGARIAPALPLVACLWLAAPSIAAAQSADLQLEHHGVSIEGTTVTIGEGDTYTHQTYLALDHTVAPGTWVRTTMKAPSGLSVSDFDERSDENKLNQGARETFIFTANQDDDCSNSSQTITYTVRDMSSNANPVYTSSASFQLTVEDDDLCADDTAITRTRPPTRSPKAWSARRSPRCPTSTGGPSSPSRPTSAKRHGIRPPWFASMRSKSTAAASRRRSG